MTDFLRASILIALLGAAGAGCADEVAPEGGGSFPDAPLVTVTGSWVVVEARSGPEQPPVRGVIELELVVTDLTDAPLDGLVIAARAWMPAMHHGASRAPAVSALGDGRYVVGELACSMAGAWVVELDVSTEDGARSERVQLPVQVR